MQSFIASETEGYADKYDAALILANVSDFAQQGALRIKWSMPMGPEMPWYAAVLSARTWSRRLRCTPVASMKMIGSGIRAPGA